MTRPIPALLVLAALGCGCASNDTLLGLYPELQQALLEFQQEQRRFASANPVPQTLEFPGHGTVTVRDVSLDGYPGSAYVRARWHYQNTTDRPVGRALVSLDVLDPQDRLAGSKVAVCILYTASPMYTGTFFADELRTRTMDAHLLPGWKWRITCKAESEEPERQP
jgi:hypothetical protein